MTGRTPTIALWLVAVLGVVLGGAALVVPQGASQADTVTTAVLEATVDDVASAIEARLAAVTADQAGATPVVNAAKLSGLTSDQLVRSDVAVTGHFNCLGIGMQPWASGMEYSANDQGRYMTKGPGLFNCMVSIPQGATITALRAAVKDNSTSFQATCYLIANSNAYPNDGYTPAFTPFSGDVTTPGDTVLEDTTIERPVVDNTKYAYLAECSLDGPGTALVLKSVSIEYSVAGLPVP